MIWLAILLPVIVVAFVLVVFWGVMQLDKMGIEDIEWRDEN